MWLSSLPHRGRTHDGTLAGTVLCYDFEVDLWMTRVRMAPSSMCGSRGWVVWLGAGSIV